AVYTRRYRIDIRRARSNKEEKARRLLLEEGKVLSTRYGINSYNLILPRSTLQRGQYFSREFRIVVGDGCLTVKSHLGDCSCSLGNTCCNAFDLFMNCSLHLFIECTYRTRHHRFFRNNVFAYARVDASDSNHNRFMCEIHLPTYDRL